MTKSRAVESSTMEVFGDSELSLCCLCGKTFSNREMLHEHFTVIHEEGSSPDERLLEEDTSNDKKWTNSAYSGSDSTGSRTYACDYCSKIFTKSCNLNSHVKAVHKGVKAFGCDDCRKSFSRNSDLQKHIDAVHRGLRPYTCSLCQKPFSQKSSLKRHVEAVHEGTKSYKCDFCESSFSYDVHLKRHLRAKHSSGLHSSQATN